MIFFCKKYGLLCLENKKNSSCGLKFDVLRCSFVQKGLRLIVQHNSHPLVSPLVVAWKRRRRSRWKFKCSDNHTLIRLGLEKKSNLPIAPVISTSTVNLSHQITEHFVDLKCFASFLLFSIELTLILDFAEVSIKAVLPHDLANEAPCSRPTALSDSKSHLFPTRTSGTSSVSLTRRICSRISCRSCSVDWLVIL